MAKPPLSIFLDIDGTLFKHRSPSEIASNSINAEILPGVKEKILEWEKKGYKIILTTGRRNSLKKQTIQELNSAGIVYDKLIMGLGGGKRVLINDFKANSVDPYAISINIERNKGIGEINLDEI